MKMIRREKWGARPPRYRNTGAMSEPSTGHWNGLKIIVNGQGTWDHSKCPGLVRGIQNFHMDGQGWSDIAYNFVVCPHGYVFEGRGINVYNGANGTNEGNRSSHAVMVLAGEGNPFPEAEKVAFKETIFHISNVSTAPNKAIGHRDHKPTKCPGDERYAWIRSGMPISTPEPPSKVKDDKMFTAVNSGGYTWLFEEGRRTLVPAADLDNVANLPALGKISDEFFERLTRNRERHQ